MKGRVALGLAILALLALPLECGVRGPVELVIIADGNHVANNRAYKYRAQSADWMAGQLAGA